MKTAQKFRTAKDNLEANVVEQIFSTLKENINNIEEEHDYVCLDYISGITGETFEIVLDSLTFSNDKQNILINNDCNLSDLTLSSKIDLLEFIENL